MRRARTIRLLSALGCVAALLPILLCAPLPAAWALAVPGTAVPWFATDSRWPRGNRLLALAALLVPLVPALRWLLTA